MTSEYIEWLKLMLEVSQVIVIPSIIWIIRYPLRSLVRIIIIKLGGELFLERFEIIDEWKWYLDDIDWKTWPSVIFVAYKNVNWYFKRKVLDEIWKVIYITNVYHNLWLWLKELVDQNKYIFVTSWWIINDNLRDSYFDKS